MPARDTVPYETQPADAGCRIDRILRRLLPGVPLSRIQAMLRRGEARLSGQKTRGSDRAQAGHVLTLSLDPADAAALRARLSGREAPPAAASVLTLPVLCEDEHLIALDKPSGVAAHPGSRHPLDKTVLGALLSITGRGTATFRPSLVGRLDRDTSGVQLAARTPQGLRGLEALSRAHGIRKTYLALARGEEFGAAGRIDLALRDRGSGRARMEVVEEARTAQTEGAGRPAPVLRAVTDYRLLARGGGATLLQVEPVTGRRHQIRAHLAHLGAPLAGDVRYGDRAWNSELRSRTGLRRLFLHCAKVEFGHPVTGVGTTILSPLPRELSAALTRLGIRFATSPNS